jgi:antitoxin ParD1/3/4
MPAQHTLHVALTGPLVKYVAEQVSSGRYATASEVVRAALRLLIERDGDDARRPALQEQAAGE